MRSGSPAHILFHAIRQVAPDILESLRDEPGDSSTAADTWAHRYHLAGAQAREAAAEMHAYWRSKPESAAKLTLFSTIHALGSYGSRTLTPAEQTVWNDFDPPGLAESWEGWQSRARRLYEDLRLARNAPSKPPRRGKAADTTLRNAVWFVKLRILQSPHTYAAKLGRDYSAKAGRNRDLYGSQVSRAVNEFARALGEPVIRGRAGRKPEVPDVRKRRSL